MGITEDSKTMIVGNSICAIGTETGGWNDNRNVTDGDFEEKTIEIYTITNNIQRVHIVN